MMPETKPSIPVPIWPESDPALEAALGRCIIRWGVLEKEIDFAIGQVLSIEDGLSDSLTANLSAGAKVQSFQSLIHNLGSDIFSDHVISQADNLVAKTQEIIGKNRNFLAHGQPWKIYLGDEADNFWAWAHLKSNKGISGKVRKLSVETMDLISDEIKDITLQWNRLRNDLVDGIEFLNFVRRG